MPLDEATRKELADLFDQRMSARLAELNVRPAVPSVADRLQALDRPQPKDEPGLNFARHIIALAAANGDVRGAAQYASRAWGENHPVSLAIGTQGASGAGVLVRPVFSSDFIELLRPAAVFRKLGARVISMDGLNLTISKQTGGASAYWGAEQSDIKSSDPSLGQINMVFKQLTCQVVMSNQLIQAATPSVEGLVRDDALAAMAQAEDLAFIAGTGMEDKPKGVRYQMASGNVVSANGTVSVQNTSEDLGKLVLKLQAANAPMRKLGWIMPPDPYQFLLTLQNSQGAFVFRDELLRGTLWGYPVAVTTNVSSQVYLIDLSEVIIGESSGLMVDVSREASYYDAGGTLRSAWGRNETVMRVIRYVDIALRHDVSCALLDSVTWTPGAA